MKSKIRIASGQGFWGDLIDAPFHQVTKGGLFKEKICIASWRDVNMSYPYV